MAGGSYIAQDKIRPGAYINFTAAKKLSGSIGLRGVAAIPVSLPWGSDGKAIKINAQQFINGESLPLIGLRLGDTDKGAQMLKEAFRGCFEVLAYRINGNGTKATATISTGVTATAKHTGTAGNKLTVVIEETDVNTFVIRTLYNSAIKNEQTIATIADFVSNDWISITGTGTITETAGIPLTGGTDGTVTDDSYTAFYDAMVTESWNTMAIPSATAAATAKTYIKMMIDNEGRYVQAVVPNLTNPNYEGIINTKGQGYVTSTGERIEPDVFTCYVAGITAGAQINDSNTYRVVDDAVEIINPLRNSEIEAALKAGYFVLSQRQDGVVVVESDINSLITFTEVRPKAWHKNRPVRVMHGLASSIRDTFERNYIGSSNTDSGRIIFKSDIVGLMTQAQRMGAIQNFDSTTDITVVAGDEIDSVMAKISAQPVDAMEKLYADIELR